MDPMTPSDEIRLALLEQADQHHSATFSRLEEGQKRMNEVLGGIKDNLGKLVVIEDRHIEFKAALDRAFTSLKEQGAAIQQMQKDMPGLLEARRWVVAGVLFVVTMVGATCFRVVTNQPSPQQTAIVKTVP